MNWRLPDNHDLGNLLGALGHVDNFDLCIEAGAHRGIWTRHLVEKFDTVICFEPGDMGKEITERATVYPYAVGANGGTCSMQHGQDNSGQHHIINEDGPIEMVRIDDFNFKGICGFFKCDVEGFELFALQGAKELLRRDRPVVLIEENGLCERYGVKTGEAGNYLKSLGAVKVDTFNKDEVYKWI